MRTRRKTRSGALALAACLGLSGCSPSAEPDPYRGFPGTAFMNEDLVAQTGPHDPMYLRLPPGVDQRGWGLMLEGKRAWTSKGGHRQSRAEPLDHTRPLRSLKPWRGAPVWSTGVRISERRRTDDRSQQKDRL